MQMAVGNTKEDLDSMDKFILAAASSDLQITGESIEIPTIGTVRSKCLPPLSTIQYRQRDEASQSRRRCRWSPIDKRRGRDFS